LLAKFLFSLLLLFLFATKASACALCSLYDPTVFADIRLNMHDEKLETIKIDMEFSRLYSAQAIKTYDINQNGKLEASEEQNLTDTMFGLMHDQHYYTKISVDSDELAPLKSSDIFFKNMRIDNTTIYFSYVIKVDRATKDEFYLRLVFEDKDLFFGFFPRKEQTKINGDDSWCLMQDSNFYQSIVVLHLKKCDAIESTMKREPLPQIREKSLQIQLSEILHEYLFKIEQRLAKIKEEFSLLALFGLMSISFLYGAVHAMGPGHGKMLVGSYSIANKKSALEIWKIALGIGVVHVLSAFVISMIAYLIIDVVASTVVQNSEKAITFAVGVMILGIAFYMLYKKLLPKEEHNHSCGCCSCSGETKKSDFGVMLGAGIVPCPGAVLVLTAVMGAGAYLAGTLSAIAMSLGMTVVIGIVGTLGVVLRGSLEKRLQRFLKIAEYIALTTMMLIAVLMIIASI